jgi:UDP-N-acetylmuramate dehydrogenase
LPVTDVFEEIDQLAGIASRKDELLSLHTSFGVGGPCDLMVWVSDVYALKSLLALAKTHSLPVTTLGKGSNVLVRDGGISGVVVRLVDEFATIETVGEHIHAGAGASLGEVVSTATSSGIGGLEFLAGIPGTVGGAVVTNAGSRDVWVSSRLVELGVLTGDLAELRLTPGDVEFGYRYSAIDTGWIVTDVVLGGYRCAVDEARHKVEEYLDMRRSTQPTGENTAGCVFKNPRDDAAGRVIDHAGLKGTRKGGAEISTVHGNWIVNTGGATAGEILDLIDETREKIRDGYGIDLELEINVIGRD